VRRSRSVPVAAVLLPAIALEMAVAYLVMHNSSWVYDDNFYLTLVGREGLSWHWLGSVQFEHWNVAGKVVQALEHRLFYFDYRWVLAAMLLALGGCTFVFERALALLVRRRWIAVALALWFGASLLWARPLQWLSAGMQYVPSTLLSVVCLYAFLRYQGDRASRWVWLSAIAFAGALMFFEKSAYVPFYLLLVRVLLLSSDLRPRPILRALWRERALWLAYAAVLAVWLLGYLHAHAYGAHARVSVGQYLDYFGILWTRTVVPWLMGIDIPAAHLSTIQIAGVAAGQAVVAVLLVVSLGRSRRAWRGWAFLAIVIVAGGLLSAYSRVGQFGVSVADDPRYVVDLTWLVPLGLIAVFQRDGLLAIRVPGEQRLPLPSSLRLAPAVAVAAVLLGAGAATASAAHLEKLWAGPQARSWATNVRKGFARQERPGARPVVLESATPFEIMPAWLAPYNRLSTVLPLYVGSVQVDGPVDSSLVRVAPDGTVHRVAVAPAAGSGGVPALLAARALTFTGGRLVRRGDQLCVIADDTAATVERRLGAALDPAGGPYYLLLGYRVWRPIAVAVAADTGAGPPSAPVEAVGLMPGADRSIAWLGEGSTGRVTLTIPPLSTVCLDRFEVVGTRDLA
jgi:hypothetical protein